MRALNFGMPALNGSVLIGADALPRHGQARANRRPTPSHSPLSLAAQTRSLHSHARQRSARGSGSTAKSPALLRTLPRLAHLHRGRELRHGSHPIG